MSKLAFIAVSAMLFATILLPKAMMSFVRHPVLLFAAGFVAVNLGKSSIGTIVACVVLAVSAVAICPSLKAGPVAGAWLWPTIEASNSHSANLMINGPKPFSTPLWDGRHKP